MNDKDIAKIARQSAKKLKLPSRRMRIIRDWYESVRWDVYYYSTYWYCRIMHKIVPKRFKHKCVITKAL